MTSLLITTECMRSYFPSSCEKLFIFCPLPKMSAFLYNIEGTLCCIPAFGMVKSHKLIRFASQVGTSCPSENMYLLLNGHFVHPDVNTFATVSSNDVLRVLPRLPGGKGGFGSMLRAIGAQIEKTTSREACRDLSGRRMRDVNDEKKITEWIAKQAEREQEAARLKQERLERKRAVPRHNFDDTTYTRQIQENADKIEDALKQGLKASSTPDHPSTSSEPTSTSGNNGKAPKKQKMWLGLDDMDDDSEEEMPVEYIHEHPESRTSTAASTVTCTTTVSSSTVDASSSQTTGEPSKSESTEGSSSDSDGPSRSTFEEKTVNEVQAGTSKENKCISGESKECAPSVEEKPFCIDDYHSAAELESLGLERLKENLTALGLKCGGTLQERAQRLFLTKGVSLDQLDPALFAKHAKGKKNKQKKC